ncbi:hypothetical protein [Allomuricauda sp. SCSIO 65647]|uniref:hypothetical protein n=1 Tax=Allomuricauda sp. SCSIO 65647 TaxID=2908843 RepID=UPI001F30748F|nr:hypothetical protein [Muricauda sp. SCSIO 65647]UJH66409.1 hypothetical protein L0P89_10560 [Muricauda sp. SCSIO 65647]
MRKEKDGTLPRQGDGFLGKATPKAASEQGEEAIQSPLLRKPSTDVGGFFFLKKQRPLL